MKKDLRDKIINQLDIGHWTLSSTIARSFNLPIEDVNRVLLPFEKETESIYRSQRHTRSLRTDYSWIKIQGKLR
jgi:hypothetical protein